MVLPIGPGDLNRIELGEIEPCDLGVQGINGTLQAFPDAPPSQVYTPILSYPRRLTVGEYSLIVNNAINRLRDMEYYGMIVDELITKRFYKALAAEADSALVCSCDAFSATYEAQVSDPNYALYLQGLNDLFPAGDPVGSINEAISTYEAGVANENIQIQLLNQAISDFIAANPPFQAIDPQSVIDLNAAINTYNSYVATRNIEIQAYNDAVDTYNADVGVANPINGEYPLNTVNRAIQDFNATYEGQGALSPLPFLPNAETRPLLIGGLPQADPSFTLTFDLDANLSISITLPVSPYTAFQYLQIESQLITVNAPTFGGTVAANDAITYYNNNYVDASQVSPSEQQAVEDLNDAIIAFNSIFIDGASNPDYGDVPTLVDAINTYNNLISNSPNFDQVIINFNAEVVDNINDLMSGASPLFDQAVAAVNNEFPAELHYPAPPNLPYQPAMPTAPSTTNLVAGEVPLLTERELYPEFVYNAIELPIQPVFAPFIDSDGTIRIDPDTGDPILQMPTAEGIPSTPTGGDFSDINDIFAQMNLDIDTYNANVGDPNAAPPASPPFTTENEAILYLNSIIEAYNANPTPTTLSDLEAAIASYTAYKTGTSDLLVDTLNTQVDAFNTNTGPNTLDALNAEITQLNIARDVYGLPPIPLYTALPSRNTMFDAPTLQGAPPTVADNPAPISIVPTRSEYTSIPLISQTAIDSIYILNQSSATSCATESAYAAIAAIISDPNFQAYVASLESPLSPSYVDLPSFNNDINNYLTTATAPPEAGKTTADYPSFTVSGGVIKVDATTQQQVNDDFAAKMTAGTLTQNDIDHYNNFAALVNTTSLVDINNTIAAFNTTVGNTGTPGVYTPNTLNWYAQEVNNTHLSTPVIGPLTIIDEVPPVPAMPAPLPDIGDVSVTINSVPVDFYSAVAQLNSDIQSEPTGLTTVAQLNTDITSYNAQVPTENSAISAMNNAITNTFPNDVSSLDYFTALANLDSYITGTYDPDVQALETGTGGNFGIDTLNASIVDFNNNSLDTLNSFSDPSIDAINAAATTSPFPAETFELLQNFSTLLLRADMPDAPDPDSGLIPGQVTPLDGGRLEYPTLEYRLELTSRLNGIPEEIPEFFSISLPNSDLENLNDNFLQPIIDKIQEYNGATLSTEGLAFEQGSVATLNAAIADFNDGNITSNQLKDAVTDYVRAISTDSPNVNGNIDILNQITDGIQKWINAFNEANTQLAYWGLSPIPDKYTIGLRSPMEAPPIPDAGYSQDYIADVNLLGEPTPQGFPSTTQTIEQNGQLVTIVVADQLTISSFININIAIAIAKRFARHAANIEQVADILERIERFVQFRADLRGERVEFPNAYIQSKPLPNFPIGEAPRVALASMMIGLSSDFFGSLLREPIFNSVASIFGINESGLISALRTSGLEAIGKAGLFASFRTVLNLSGRIPPPSLVAFRQPDATPVAAVFALNFTRELRNIINAGVGGDIVRQAIGTPLSDDVTRALSAAFNVSLLGVGLVLLARVFGPGTIPGILRQLPSIRPSGPQNVFPDYLALPTFDDMLRRSLGSVKDELVAGLEQLISEGTISVSGTNLYALVQKEIIDKLRSPFHTPQQFIDTLNDLLVKATGQRQIRELRYLAFDAAAYVADQLPFAIVNKQILDQSITRSQIRSNELRDAIASARPGSEAQADAIAAARARSEVEANAIAAAIQKRLIQDSLIRDSIIQQDALDYRLQQDRIRRDIINNNAIRQSQIDRDNTLRQVRDTIRRESIDLADRTLNALIQRDIIRRAIINEQQLSYELQRREIAEDDINRRVLEVQRRFDDLQRETVKSENEGRRLLSTALQDVFVSLNTVTADAIAQTVNVAIQAPPQTLNEDVADYLRFRELFFEVVRRKLISLERDDRLNLEDQLRRIILDDHNSFVRLMDQEVQKLVDLQNQKLDREIASLNKEFFKNFESLGNFVVDRLLVPAYSLIYSTDAGPMYDQPERNDYKRNVDILI